MPFNIAEFKANIANGGGFMKKNKFVIRMTPPRAIMQRAVGGVTMYSINRALEFYAESASIPGISMQTAEVRRQGIGNLEKVVYGAAMTDIDIRFNIDQHSDNFKFFQSWADVIYNYNPSRGTEYEMAYKDDYTTTITLFIYNEINPEMPIMIVDMYDAFPVSISDMPVDWGSTDLMKLNIRFNFLSWSERNIPGFGIRGLGGLLNLLSTGLGRTVLGIGLGIGIADSLLNNNSAGTQSNLNNTLNSVTDKAVFDVQASAGYGAFDL